MRVTYARTAESVATRGTYIGWLCAVEETHILGDLKAGMVLVESGFPMVVRWGDAQSIEEAVP